MSAVLKVAEVNAGYGAIPVLHGVSLEANQGEITAIVGANGAGKSTLLLTIAGHIAPNSGSITFSGQEIGGNPAHRAAALGIAIVPEGGRLFPFMTVEENLQLGAYHPEARRHMKTTMQEMAELFPLLHERRTQLAGALSGGERTMVAIARAMMSRPQLLMLDEPSLGLAPVMVERVIQLIETVARRGNLTVLLVEQNVAEALDLCQHAYVLERGHIVKSGTGIELARDSDIQRAYMGL